MKEMILVSIMMSFGFQCFSQQNSEHFSSMVPSNSRYELLQPKGEYGSLFTIMLDKYEGKISRLEKSDTGYFYWDQMFIDDHPDDMKKEQSVNYQIFFSADGVLLTFLVNVNTGATWRLVKDNSTGLWWSTIK